MYRTDNAPISSELAAELKIDFGNLGLLTSAYFLTFALLQLPLGTLLDRYGPLSIPGALLFVAAIGAVRPAHPQDTQVVPRSLIEEKTP